MSTDVILAMIWYETETWVVASQKFRCCGCHAVPPQTLTALRHSAVFENSILPTTTSLTLARAVCWSTYRFWTLKGL